MSGNFPIPLTKMDECPCCGKKAQISYMEFFLPGDYREFAVLRIKFHHEGITNSGNPEWLCEAEDESGGYYVNVPILDSLTLSKMTKDPCFKEIMELEAKADFRNKNMSINAEWY